MDRDEAREGSAAAGRFGVERVGSLIQTLAIVGAGAWGVYTFIYEARIKPSLAPPTVSVKTDLARAGTRDDRVAVRSTVTRTNVGQTGVRVLGLAYTVLGIRARFEPDPARAAAFSADPAGATTIQAARDYGLEPGTVILREGVLFSGATDAAAEPSDLEPGEAVSRDLIVYADRSQFDFLRVEVRLAYAKSDDPPVRLRFSTTPGGALDLRAQADCASEPDACARLRRTDYSTAFSLW